MHMQSGIGNVQNSFENIANVIFNKYNSPPLIKPPISGHVSLLTSNQWTCLSSNDQSEDMSLLTSNQWTCLSSNVQSVDMSLFQRHLFMTNLMKMH